MNTPWGQSDHERILGEGIVFYGTPSHGGFKVQHEQNMRIPVALRNKDGWYEEDCDIEILCFVFPELFPENDQERTIKYLKNHMTFEYEKATGTVVPIEESRIKREKQFYEDNAENYIVFSAIGSYKPGDPEGMVKCSACRGKFYLNRGRFYQWTSQDEAEFYVPEEEYDARGEFSFVIDTTKHIKIIGKAA